MDSKGCSANGVGMASVNKIGRLKRVRREFSGIGIGIEVSSGGAAKRRRDLPHCYQHYHLPFTDIHWKLNVEGNYY